MSTARPELPAYAIAALSIIGIVVLVALGHPVPDVLALIGTGAVGGAAGVSLNGRAVSSQAAAQASQLASTIATLASTYPAAAAAAAAPSPATGPPPPTAPPAAAPVTTPAASAAPAPGVFGIGG